MAKSKKADRHDDPAAAGEDVVEGRQSKDAETETADESEQAAESTGDKAAAVEDEAGTEKEPEKASKKVRKLNKRLAEAKEQAAEYKDQALRAQAELQNVRRRATRDVENAHKFGLEKFLRGLLPIIDSLEKAIEAAGEAAEQGEAIKEGVEICLKMLLDAMAKENVEQLDPVGEPFDPNFHEAISTVENEEVEPNSVVLVVQKGYQLNGRLIRPAMVIVSKAGEKKPSEELDETASGDG